MSLKLILVSYDIRNPKRLRKIHKIMKGYGDGIHYSVFRCHLNRKGIVEMKSDLKEIMHNDEDRIMIIDIGPIDRAKKRITYLGDIPKEKEQDYIIM